MRLPAEPAEFQAREGLGHFGVTCSLLKIAGSQNNLFFRSPSPMKARVLLNSGVLQPSTLTNTVPDTQWALVKYLLAKTSDNAREALGWPSRVQRKDSQSGRSWLTEVSSIPEGHL